MSQEIIDRLTTAAEMMKMSIPVPPAVLTEAVERIQTLEGVLAAVIEAEFGYGLWPSEEVLRAALKGDDE